MSHGIGAGDVTPSNAAANLADAPGATGSIGAPGTALKQAAANPPAGSTSWLDKMEGYLTNDKGELGKIPEILLTGAVAGFGGNAEAKALAKKAELEDAYRREQEDARLAYINGGSPQGLLPANLIDPSKYQPTNRQDALTAWRARNANQGVA